MDFESKNFSFVTFYGSTRTTVTAEHLQGYEKNYKDCVNDRYKAGLKLGKETDQRFAAMYIQQPRQFRSR